MGKKLTRREARKAQEKAMATFEMNLMAPELQERHGYRIISPPPDLRTKGEIPDAALNEAWERMRAETKENIGVDVGPKPPGFTAESLRRK